MEKKFDDQFDLKNLVGVKIKGSTAADTQEQKAPRDHKITEVWGPNENGQYVAWSVGAYGGEHLIANSKEALVRRVMSLA